MAKKSQAGRNDGSCVRLRRNTETISGVNGFVMDRTHDWKPFRMLCVIDEFTRECLAIRIERMLTARIVLEALANLFLSRGPPDHIRSDTDRLRRRPSCQSPLPTTRRV